MGLTAVPIASPRITRAFSTSCVGAGSYPTVYVVIAGWARISTATPRLASADSLPPALTVTGKLTVRPSSWDRTDSVHSPVGTLAGTVQASPNEPALSVLR